MRWKDSRQPFPGETRTRRCFLWLPKTLDRETRWLERATIIQRWPETGRLEWRDRAWCPPGDEANHQERTDDYYDHVAREIEGRIARQQSARAAQMGRRGISCT